MEAAGDMAGHTTPTSDEMREVAARIFDFARNGETDALQTVIERGVPPNLRNERGDSLIMLAAYHGHAATVGKLMALKADPNLTNSMDRRPWQVRRSRDLLRWFAYCSTGALMSKARRQTAEPR